MNLKVKMKRVDTSLPIPKYETFGSNGFDILSRETVSIEPGEISLIPSNLIIEVPKGYTLILASRSSTPRKYGVIKPHGIGIIDQDYCGPDDEILLQVKNFTNELVTIERGSRIAQGLFVRCDQACFIESEEINLESRGGFGSTG